MSKIRIANPQPGSARHTTVWHGDIARLSVEECLRITGLQPGELDVLEGSPPCQGFSTAGKRKSSPQSSTTGLIHPYEIRHLTSSEIKLMSSFPESFKLEGSFVEKWARVGNSVPPLFMRAIAEYILCRVLERVR